MKKRMRRIYTILMVCALAVLATSCASKAPAIETAVLTDPALTEVTSTFFATMNTE